MVILGMAYYWVYHIRVFLYVDFALNTFREVDIWFHVSAMVQYEVKTGEISITSPRKCRATHPQNSMLGKQETLWLVVWNMNFIFHMLGIIIPTD